MLTCPFCGQPIRPGQPVAIVKMSDRRTVVLHLEPCGWMLLVLATRAGERESPRCATVGAAKVGPGDLS